MANAVDKDYTYVVSLISHYYMPETLERWWDYQDAGDRRNPPSGRDEYKRHVIGSIAQLPEGNFNLNTSVLDFNQKGIRIRKNPGWPEEDMGSVAPKNEFNYFSYDENYLEGGDDSRPPGATESYESLIIIPMRQDLWVVYATILN